MSTATLTCLLDYLYGTLSPDNMRWVGEHLIEHAKKEQEHLKPMTMEEINAQLNQALSLNIIHRRNSSKASVFSIPSHL